MSSVIEVILTQVSLDCLWASPVDWRPTTLPPAVGWGPGTLMSAGPAAGYCSWELPPELQASVSAPHSPAATCPSACKHIHTHSHRKWFLLCIYTCEWHVKSWHNRVSHMWKEFTFSCRCKLASRMDSFMSTDDLSNFVWLSICTCKMQTSESYEGSRYEGLTSHAKRGSGNGPFHAACPSRANTKWAVFRLTQHKTLTKGCSGKDGCTHTDVTAIRSPFYHKHQDKLTAGQAHGAVVPPSGQT